MLSNNFSFFEQVYAVCELIPFGRITTYGAIARCIGSPGAARMVGWAMNASHSSTRNVPAHRVVNRNGMLSGKHHFGNPELMQQLLEQEGVEVEDNRILNFSKHFWNPLVEIKI